MSAPAPVISPELKALLRRVKLGKALDTLPERLALAKTRTLGHAEFLELVLSDEVTRRETTSAALRARTAGLDPAMCLENWDDTTKVSFDHATWDELCSLRFVDAGHNVVVMGPVGVGKTFLASALGHAAVRRRYSVIFERTDTMLKRLRASRLDNSHDVELRKLLRVDLLILDDFALQALDPLDTADVYELIVERHRAASTVVTSNREPIEWLGQMADALLAQSAIDRLQSAAYELDDALERLRGMGADVDGEVGDQQPLMAISDALLARDVDEIILSTLPPGASRWLAQDIPHRVKRAFPLPVTHIVAPSQRPSAPVLQPSPIPTETLPLWP